MAEQRTCCDSTIDTYHRDGCELPGVLRARDFNQPDVLTVQAREAALLKAEHEHAPPETGATVRAAMERVQAAFDGREKER